MNPERSTSQRGQTSASSRPTSIHDFGTNPDSGVPSTIVETSAKQKRFDLTFMHQKVFLAFPDDFDLKDLSI
ncbi:unnamed protein product [Cylindrotheca closterium]|uniref:Uncharacterized protein n=1 Tax=Cylindrotheca closterium TaxID=2856 RepID=A0AAD2G2H0_9STRA|nr:unnamed protein product [Cylindrotheca closterium]